MSEERLGPIAFGLYGHVDGRKLGMLERFAKHVGARQYGDLHDVSDPSNFPTEKKLEELMRRADRIHFNLDGVIGNISELEKAVEKGSLGMSIRYENGWGNITNWELWRIVNDSRLYKKTRFYLDGSEVTPNA